MRVCQAPPPVEYSFTCQKSVSLAGIDSGHAIVAPAAAAGLAGYAGEHDSFSLRRGYLADQLQDARHNECEGKIEGLEWNNL